jgi:hypothetical protein
MRGAHTFTESLFTMRKLVDFVPARHPLREIRETANAALEKLGPMFTAMYAAEVKGLQVVGKHAENTWKHPSNP